MPSPTPVPARHVTASAAPQSAQDSPVLDRVADRVRQRLEAEQAATNSVGDGAHAASLIWPWPL
ncbi:HaaA family cyclophane-containing RiPP peptide [Streptomyces sp. NPDC005962]|uniref:HaaA family cyclophane-containing RiPP peptide n=1 Tax=Streptomyces sp. NPDC005962 TaxID=3154466 RepID=UPI0033ECE015